MARFLFSVVAALLLISSTFASQSDCQQGELWINSSCQQIPYIEGCLTYECSGSCNACQYGYSLQNGICTQTPSNQQCCASYSMDGSCSQCTGGLYLEQSQCYRIVIPGCLQKNGNGNQCLVCAKGYNLQNGQCIARIFGCISYAGNGECVACDKNFYLNNSICHYRPETSNCLKTSKSGCIQCNDNYFLASDRSCQSYEAGCLSYYQGKCRACSPQFQLIGSKCTIDNCLRYSNDGCAACITPYNLDQDGRCSVDNCLKSVGGICSECKNNYRIGANGKCVQQINFVCKSCPPGYVYSGNSCVISMFGCLTYDSSGLCTRCSDPFVLTINGKCQITGCQTYNANGCANCINPFQLSNNICIIDGCDQITIDGCAKCADGYYFSNKKCYKKDTNCKTYQVNQYGNEECSQCFAGYFLNANKVCIKKEIGCIYDSNFICSSCLPNFVRNQQGKCQIYGCLTYNSIDSTCTSCASPFIASYGTCSIPYCSNYGRNGCTACTQGYVVANGICIKGDCYCDTYGSNGVCQKCKSGFTLDANLRCIKIISHCITMNPDRINCDQCQSGYSQIGGQCIKTIQNCKIQQSDSTLCSQCFDGYHLSKGFCITNDILCVKYTKITQYDEQCSACQSGYYPSNGVCTASAPGCIYDASNQCSSCSPPFTYKSNSCYIPGCSLFDATGCQTCISPFFKRNKVCVIDFCLTYSDTCCTACINGYQVSNGLCVSVDPNCLQFDQNNKCTQCAPTFNLVQGKCVITDINCLSYGNDGSCLKCKENYYLNQNKKCQVKDLGCIYERGVCAYCQLPFTMSSITQKCQIKSCLQATAQGCLTCRYPFKVDPTSKSCIIEFCQSVVDGACVQCNQGYHLKQGVACQINDINCLAYDSDGNCQQCADKYLLMSSGKCQKAVRTCLQFSTQDPNKCLACQDGYYLNRFFQCQFKEANCTEYTNGVCSKCEQRFFLWDGICFPFTPGCVQYCGKDCTKCKIGYTLTNGQCLKWNAPGMKLQGTDDNYDFQITPIDVRQSKYYIDNLSPVSAIGKIIYSSSFNAEYENCSLTSDSGSNSKGWKAKDSDDAQYLGYTVIGNPVTFFALQLQAVEGNYITNFYLQYSVNGSDYIRVENSYNVSTDILTGTVTIYFTGIYAQSIRIRINKYFGWPAARLEFFFYDYLRFKKISNLKSLKYLTEAIQSNFVDRVDNQIYINQIYFFNPQAACANKEVCFTGLQLCQPKLIKSVTLSFSNLPDQVTQFYVTYSLDGKTFNCYQSCMKFTVSIGSASFNLPLNGLKAQNVRIYPSKYNGKPSFNTAFDYQ